MDIYEAARRQHGVFSLDQARRGGLSDDQVYRRCESGLLIPDHVGVFRIAGAPHTWFQRAMAATLASGELVVLSYAAAAALWDLPDCPQSRIEVTVPHHHDYVAHGVIPHWSRHMDPIDRTLRMGIPVTSPTRTLLDLASRFSVDRLFEAMDDLYRRRLSSPTLTSTRLEALGGRGRKGTRLIRAMLGDYLGQPVPRSVFERRFYRALAAAGIRRPERNAMVKTRVGIIEVDFIWRPEGLVAETDGGKFHDSRVRTEQDSIKRAALTAVGLSVMTVRYPRLKYATALVMRDVADSLAARRQRAA